MIILRWLLAGMVICGFACAVNAQEKKPDYPKFIIGVWEVEPKGADAKSSRLLFEFNKDGKVKMILKGKGKDVTVEGTYKIVGDKLETAIKGNKESVTISKITEKEIVTTDTDGADLHLFRVK